MLYETIFKRIKMADVILKIVISECLFRKKLGSTVPKPFLTILKFICDLSDELKSIKCVQNQISAKAQSLIGIMIL